MRIIVWRGYLAKRNGRLLYIYIYMYVCEVLTTVFRRSIIHNVDMVKIYMDSVLDFLSPSHHRF